MAIEVEELNPKAPTDRSTTTQQPTTNTNTNTSSSNHPHHLSSPSPPSSNLINIANPASAPSTSTPILNLFNSSIIDLIFSLPPQLLSLLLVCSSPIHLLSQLSLIITWSHPLGPWPSWSLLFLWFTLCSSLPYILSYSLPNLISLLILLISPLYYYLYPRQHQKNIRTSNPTLPAISHPIAIVESLESLQTITDHYATISNHLQPIYHLIRWSDPKSSVDAIKTCLTSIPFSILITHFISTRSILMISGSILIVWSSKWFQTLKNLIWRSLILRLLILSLVDICIHARFCPSDRFHQLRSELDRSSNSFFSSLRTLFAQLPPKSNQLNRADSNEKSTIDPESDCLQQIEICLTIFENQRWWMGLDWSPNLLPHERPNWTDSINRPVPPPSSFKLPSPIVLTDSIRKVQRKVEWKWVDSYWKIIEAHPAGRSKGDNSPSREKFNPKINNGQVNKSSQPNDTPPCSPDLSKLQNHQRSVSQTSSTYQLDSEIIHESLRSAGFASSLMDEHDPTLAWDVDSNGWQYGDNHWDKMSKKSSMGRFTRRRAWARRVALVAHIEPIEKSESLSTPDGNEDENFKPNDPPLSASLSSPSSSSSGSPNPNGGHLSSPSIRSSSTSINSKRSLGLFRRKKNTD